MSAALHCAGLRSVDPTIDIARGVGTYRYSVQCELGRRTVRVHRTSEPDGGPADVALCLWPEQGQCRSMIDAGLTVPAGTGSGTA